MVKINKLLNRLANGRTYTANQIVNELGLASPHSAIRRLREEGFAIYTNKKTTSNGNTISVYRLGKPSARFTRNLNAGRTQLAIKSLVTRAA